MTDLRYEAPATLQAAVALLAGATGPARVLAGGTDVIVQMETDLIEPALLVDAGPVGLGISPWLITGASAGMLLLFVLVIRKAVGARSRPAYLGPEALLGSLGEARESLDPEGTVFVAGALWRAVAARRPLTHPTMR